jgi:hypothetical protein
VTRSTVPVIASVFPASTLCSATAANIVAYMIEDRCSL